jgi:hypothetical protein
MNRALQSTAPPAQEPVSDTHVPQALPEVLFVADLARVLRMSRRAIDRARKFRTFPIPQLPALGGRPRWSRVAVERFLAGESATPSRGLVNVAQLRRGR